KANRTVAIIPAPLYPDPQGIFFDRGRHQLILAGSYVEPKHGGDDVIALGIIKGNRVGLLADHQGTLQGGSPSVAAQRNHDGKRLALLPLTFGDAVAVINAD